MHNESEWKSPQQALNKRWRFETWQKIDRFVQITKQKIDRLCANQASHNPKGQSNGQVGTPKKTVRIHAKWPKEQAGSGNYKLKTSQLQQIIQFDYLSTQKYELLMLTSVLGSNKAAIKQAASGDPDGANRY